MRDANEGTLVTASADDPAIDWEASETTASDWALGNSDTDQLALKAITGQTITEFRYRLLTDLEYTELLQYVPRNEEESARMMLLALKVYDLCISSVTRGQKTLDPSTDIKKSHKWNCGLRAWRASQLAEDDRDF